MAAEIRLAEDTEAVDRAVLAIVVVVDTLAVARVVREAGPTRLVAVVLMTVDTVT